MLALRSSHKKLTHIVPTHAPLDWHNMSMVASPFPCNSTVGWTAFYTEQRKITGSFCCDQLMTGGFNTQTASNMENATMW